MLDVKHIFLDGDDVMIIFHEFPAHLYCYRYYAQDYPRPFNCKDSWATYYDEDPSISSSMDHFLEANQVLGDRESDNFAEACEGDGV